MRRCVLNSASVSSGSVQSNSFLSDVLISTSYLTIVDVVVSRCTCVRHVCPSRVRHGQEWVQRGRTVPSRPQRNTESPPLFSAAGTFQGVATQAKLTRVNSMFSRVVLTPCCLRLPLTLPRKKHLTKHFLMRKNDVFNMKVNAPVWPPLQSQSNPPPTHTHTHTHTHNRVCHPSPCLDPILDFYVILEFHSCQFDMFLNLTQLPTRVFVFHLLLVVSSIQH